jgi:hypothetical protein
MADHDMGSMPAATQEVDGSAEASSPEAEEFCAAVVAAEAAANSEDPAAIEAAFAEAVALAPADLADAVATATSSSPESPEFTEAYGQIIEWMKANCGYAELNVAGSDYAFGGLPTEAAAGPTIITLENIGEEVHEIVIFRINEDVTASIDELLALPEEELFTMMTFAGFTYAYPGDVSNATADLAPGRHIAICFIPEGSTPEIVDQTGVGPEASAPPGVTLGPPHFTLGMIQEFTVA